MNILYVLVFVFCCSGQGSYGKLCGEECCAFYFKSNGDCKECPTGTIRLSEDDEGYCRPCQRGFYGYKCVNICKCSKHERCDSLRGCISKGGDVNSQQVGSDTNIRSIQSTTNELNLKDEKDTECPPGTVRFSGDSEDYCRPCQIGFYGYKCLNSCQCPKHERCDLSRGCISKGGEGTRFNYKEILLDIIPFVVLAFVILVIGSILKRANDSCKRYEVDSIADNKSHHDGNNETGSKNYNKNEFSARD